MEVAEREADGFSTAAALREVEQDAKAAIPSLSLGFRPSEQAAEAGAMAAARVDAARAAGLACGWGRNVSLALAYENDASDLSGTKAKALADWDVQAVTLLRCISGDRLGATPVIEPAWATATVVMLAQAAYEHRSLPTGHLDPDRLAALADAVEAAGCTDAELLGHLRSPGPHVRGWFALELLLGRE